MSIIPKNENKGDEMVEIRDTIHTYVTASCRNESVEVHRACSFPINLHGDYLTPCRARGAKKVKINANSPPHRLEGAIPAAADWHTNLKLLGVRNL